MLLKLGRRVPTQANKEIIKGRKNNQAVMYLMQIRVPQDSLRKTSLPPTHAYQHKCGPETDTGPEPPNKAAGSEHISTPKPEDWGSLLYPNHLCQLTGLWDLSTKSEQWTGTLWGGTNKIRNISYFRFLSLGRTISHLWYRNRKQKLHIWRTRWRMPCLCVWHRRGQTNPRSVSRLFFTVGCRLTSMSSSATKGHVLSHIHCPCHKDKGRLDYF